MKNRQRQKNCQKRSPEQAVVDVVLDALVRLEEKLLALQTLDNFDREILGIIAPALNAARGVRRSHSADLEVIS